MAYTYSKIATYTVGSGGVANISFLNIPQTYTDLILKYSTRDGNSGYWSNVLLTFNSTTVGYSTRIVANADGTTTSAISSDTARIIYNYSTATSATANTFSNTEIYIPNYTSNVIYKSVSIDSVTENNGTQVLVGASAGLWSNSSPITSITITPASGNFAQYSSAHLYGIKAEL